MNEYGLLYLFLKYLLLTLMKIFFRVEYHFHPDIDWSKGYLIVSNHCSHLDPPLVGCGMPARLHFFAKAELFTIPVIGYLIKDHLGCVPVKRGTADLRALKATIHYLKTNENIGVFPEGTRSKDGKMKKAKGGVAMMAYQSKSKVLPVYISGSYNAFPSGAKFFKLKKIHVYFGKPYVPTQYDEKKSKEIYQQIADTMMDKVREIAINNKVLPDESL